MKNAMNVTVLPSDGIGQEAVPQAVKVLRALERGRLSFDLIPGLIGGVAVAAGEAPLPQLTLDLARASDAILFGAVGDYANDKLQPGTTLLGTAAMGDAVAGALH